MKNKIAITTGDVNGIGAEITIKALKDFDCRNFVLISNRKVLKFYGAENLPCDIIEIPYAADIIPGEVTFDSGEFSYQAIKKACEIRPKAIVTAPVSKEALHMAGHNFNGQTEILEYFLAKNGQKSEMLFCANDFRVLLLTRHCALKDVKISKELIKSKVNTLINYLHIPNIKIGVCSLNPHAGENGVIGNEENELIIPTINELRNLGVNIDYPKPSDTLFIDAKKAYEINDKPPYDCYLAMYHDQGLIPMKLIAGYNAVNVTIGLDILRTSPSHGTAFDIAGKNIADCSSMKSALIYALYNS